jgi:3-isopropylmalate dehydrogenase
MIDRCSHSVAVVPGDGIGPEVINAALEVAVAVSRNANVDLEFEEHQLGAERWLQSGEVLTAKDLERLSASDAILLGALGDPRVPPGVLEVGIIVGIRRSFQQTVNLRPVQLLPGVRSPLRDGRPESVDFVVVRENTEGLYAGGSSAAQVDTPHAVAVQTSITTRAATERVVRYAYELASARRRHLTVCHKTNILIDAGRIWHDVANDLAEQFPQVERQYIHADAMTLHLVEHPERFDVIVTDNLFGDILSDLGAALAGGLGTAASGNLCLDGTGPSMFEPVHGSAPDIAGTGSANPAAAILSAGMMLEALGHRELGAACAAGVKQALLDSTDRRMDTKGFGRLAADFAVDWMSTANGAEQHRQRCERSG